MATQWLVLFDSQGLDWLIDCSTVQTEEVMRWMGGEKHKNVLGHQLGMMVLRAKANPQRFPEVWAYTTEDDISEKEMVEMWRNAPQNMADLIRQKGRCFYKFRRQKEVIR